MRSIRAGECSARWLNMNISGILSGVTNPLGTGYVLSRAAVRFAPIQPADPVRPRTSDEQLQRGVAEDAGPGSTLFDTQDVVELSPAAERAASRADRANAEEARRDSQPGGNATPGGGELTEQEQAQVEELERGDERIRQHEAAHLAAGGAYVRGGARFEYKAGPDGKLYAVAGEVQIDTTPIPNDPQATIRKMETVRAAALAPSDPSPEDRAVAARASALIREARAELAQQRSEETTSGMPANTPSQLIDTYA